MHDPTEPLAWAARNDVLDAAGGRGNGQSGKNEKVKGVNTMETVVEAVIIPGPGRGEIIQLPDEDIPEVSNEDIQLLNEALDELIGAIDRVATEVHATSEALVNVPISGRAKDRAARDLVALCDSMCER
jgi:hypothetical protein